MTYIYGMRTCILLGSNIEPRGQNLVAGFYGLTRCGTIVKASQVYETEPWGMPPGSAWFLNACVLLDTPFTPRALLKACLNIERLLGRQRSVTMEPRELDLDILLYGEMVVNEHGLQIPHPRMQERRFVLAPLADVAPDWTHPTLHKTVAELLMTCDDASVVKSYDVAV